MDIHDTVEKLRRFVARDPERGAILEEDREPPEDALNDGYLREDVPRRWARAEPGEAIHPDDAALLPASFVALIERHGSLHWVPPEDYDGDFGYRNNGPAAFLALAWPPVFSPADFLPSLGAELVARLEAAGVDQFTVFHDCLGDFAAFDARLRDVNGQPLVVEGFDDDTWIERVLTPPTVGKTFEAWLTERIAAVKASLAESA